MSGEPSTLQKAVRLAVERSGKPRDHFDKLLQQRLGTKGKPIYDIDRGKSKSPSAETLQAIADAFELPLSFFTGRQDGGALVLPPPQYDGAEIVTIDKLDLSLSMGPGTVIDDYVHSEPVAFDLAFIRAITRSPSNRLKLVTGIGDSMYPTLNWGDAILVDTTDRHLAKQDGIYWIDLYGAAGLKRLRTVARDRVLVISDNPAVADQEVAAEDLRIEGRAIWVARGL